MTEVPIVVLEAKFRTEIQDEIYQNVTMQFLLHFCLLNNMFIKRLDIIRELVES